LLKVENPPAVGEALEKPLGKYLGKKDLGLFSKPGTDYVIVRADEVREESGWSLVVAIDAPDDGSLNRAVQDLTAAVGPRLQGIMILRVTAHHPKDPHAAHSFVETGELARFPVGGLKGGARDWPESPGANPWG
jgi:hypothetical protein